MIVVPRSTVAVSRPQARLSIALVDRGPLFLAALAKLLGDAFPRASLRLFVDSDRAMRAISEQPVDLLVCEAHALPVAGPELAARISQMGLTTRVMLLGEKDDGHLLVGSLSCGAAGFFTKDASPEELVEGLAAMLAGHYVVGRELIHLSLERLSGRGSVGDENTLVRLSETERGILAMLGQAQSTRAIAATRGISPKTVRNHLASIYRKIDVRNRSEAIVWSARAGLTEPTSD